jgi:pilin isopeptide linkage protein
VDTGDTGEALNNGEFSFVLSGSDGSVLQTAQNASDGSVPFAPLSFDHAGVFSFSVGEVDSGLAGWSYDASLFDVRVSVSDDGSGQLKADTVITKRDVSADVTEDDAHGDDVANATDDADAQPVDVIEFSNSYAVSPVSVRFGAVKMLSGDLAGKPGDRRFSFELHETTDGKDELLQTAQNDDDGFVKFVPVSFSSPGEHTFSIREVVDRKADGNVSYSFDDTMHVVKVSVTNGHDGLLHAVVAYDDGKGAEDTADTGTDADTDSALGGVNGQLASSSLENDASVVSVVGSLPTFVNGTVVIAQSTAADYGNSAVQPVQDGSSAPVSDVVQSSDSDAVVQTGDGLVGVSVVALMSIVIMLAIAAVRRRTR